jgi:two-component system, OmpR family, response regulator
VDLRTYIVEDNPTILENLVETLQELTCVRAIGSAHTETDGRALLTQNGGDWDLAIVDIFLKQGSGLGVLAACRDRRPDQQVVVLTNYATADMRKRCLELGANEVFDKSNDIDALIAYCTERCKAPGALDTTA